MTSIASASGSDAEGSEAADFDAGPGPSPLVLFVHLPLLPGQPRPAAQAFSLPLEEHAECVRQVLLACLGCGGAGEKDKYKDFDRPKPAEKAGEK